MNSDTSDTPSAAMSKRASTTLIAFGNASYDLTVQEQLFKFLALLIQLPGARRNEQQASILENEMLHY